MKNTMRLLNEKNKYKNRKVTVDGIEFASKKECNRWFELKLLERARQISNLERQKKFVLIPAQRDASGKLIEHECSYVADFVYVDNATGETVVEDTKGARTKDYIIKRKMMLYFHGIRIREV